MATRMSGENLLERYQAGNRNFQKMNLSRISLKKAYLREANFQGANLQGANLQQADLRWAILEGANLKNANLEEANLVGAKLDGAILEGANLKWVSFEELSDEDYALKYESNIIWLKDISKIDYVRPGFGIFSNRKGEIKSSKYFDMGQYFEIVGYGELEDDTPPSYWRTPKKWFSRRIFFLKEDDRFFKPEGVYKFGNHPSEAIDPLSVVKKHKGEVTDRVKGIV